MLTVLVQAEERTKTIGIVRLNLSEFLNREKLPVLNLLQQLPIEKSVDPHARLEVKISIAKDGEPEVPEEPPMEPPKAPVAEKEPAPAKPALGTKTPPLKINRNMLKVQKEANEESEEAKLAAAQLRAETREKEGA